MACRYKIQNGGERHSSICLHNALDSQSLTFCKHHLQPMASAQRQQGGSGAWYMSTQLGWFRHISIPLAVSGLLVRLVRLYNHGSNKVCGFIRNKKVTTPCVRLACDIVEFSSKFGQSTTRVGYIL